MSGASRHKVLVMGVAGCGKSTVASMLATELGAALIEGDEHHPPASQEKMRNGVALSDSDREPWLDRLGALLAQAPGNAVLACSALKRSYRDRLRAAEPDLRVVYLEISLAEAHCRVAARKEHFFPPGLVVSQFASLEVPTAEAGVLQLPAHQPLAAQASTIMAWLGRNITDKQGTMGTASTMASMVEALGIGLPGNAAYPAVDGRRNVLARMAGRRAVEMVHEDLTLSKILTRQAFENAIKTLAAIGGSTNAVIHLIAIARRIGVQLAIEDFDRLASELPCLVNLQPSGKYLMEDFCYAGGLPVVMKEIAQHLHLDAITASGRKVGENIADAQNYNAEVIKTLASPFKDKAGIAVLRGNLAPRGAVIKPSAATPELMVHKGRAVVFENIEDFHKRIDDENLDVDETCVLVLKNCGPKGYPGMAEVGNMPLPPKVLRKGITDMVRISDARMSGTAYGTVVLHTAPEAAAGGPLAIVQDGDLIELDVPNRRIQLHISDEEMARRLAQWKAPEPPLKSGYWKLYIDHVLQADEGVDLDFLVGKRGAFVPRDNH